MASATNETKIANFYLGGYDAKSCPEFVRKNFDDTLSQEDKDPFPPGDVARMLAGVEYEPVIGLKLKAALGSKFLAIPECTRTESSKKAREKLTLETMKDPGNVKIIWNARLPKLKKSHQTGEPDALCHYGISSDGVHQWVPIDVKKHGSLEGTRANEGTLVSMFNAPKYTKAVTVDMGKGVGKKADALQLAHYYRMLDNLGHAPSVKVGGIIGDDALECIVWHNLEEPLYRHSVLGLVSALSYYDYEFAHRVDIVEAALKGVALVGPEWKAECHSCIWRTMCHDQLKIELDHITLLAGVTPSRAEVHYAMGINRISDLSRLDWKTAKLVDASIDVVSLMSWAAEVAPDALVSSCEHIKFASNSELFALLGISTAADVLTLDPYTAKYSKSKVWNLSGTIDVARVYKVGKVYKARGVSSVTINRSVYEQDVDIEDSNGYVYMIGVRTSGHKKINSENRETRAEYCSFTNWDKSADGEAKVFADFWRHVQFSRSYAQHRKYGYRLYYYTHHEPVAFKNLAARHAGKPGVPTVTEVESLFNSTMSVPVLVNGTFVYEDNCTPYGETVDMYPIIANQLIWPTESVTLKETAKWVRFSWRDSDPGGSNSMAWYEAAVNSESSEVREENRNRILEYNADDVHAQVAIRDWLTSLGEARHPGKKLPDIATLDRRFKHRLPVVPRRHPSLGNA